VVLSKRRDPFSPQVGRAPDAEPAAAEKRPAQWLRNSAILFSFCLHAAVGLALFGGPDSAEQFGTLANKTDAISMATEQTFVLESIDTESLQTVAAASAAAQAGSVQSVDSIPQLTETKEVVEATEPPPKPVDVAEVKPSEIPTDDPLPVIRGGAAPDEVSEAKAIEKPETVEDVKPTEVTVKEAKTAGDKRKEEAEKKERKRTAQAAFRASSAGSTTSRGSAASSAVSGRVSASRGNILNYAARIRAVLARHKPAGDGRRGTTRVLFGLTTTGDLKYAEIAKSSGRADLDKAALAAVRRAAPFGQPPVGASPKQLRFTIPFYFR
jgi:protein TonB